MSNEHVTGHSMRPSGAQFLARAGLDTYTIQILGRWGSNTVEQYVREAVVSEAASRARASQLARTLDHMAGDVAAATSMDRFDRDQVREWVRQAFVEDKGLTEEIAKSLVDMVSARVHSSVLQAGRPDPAVGGRSDSSSEASEGDAPGDPPPAGQPQYDTEVSNHKRKRRHRILVGPPTLETLYWITPCGWRFGHSAEARMPREGDDLCTRCFRTNSGGSCNAATAQA